MKIRLMFFRFMESMFSCSAYWFGNWADSIDKDLHERLRLAMNEVPNNRQLIIKTCSCPIYGDSCRYKGKMKELCMFKDEREI